MRTPRNGKNEGASDNPNYRSRLVAREVNTYKRDDLVAPLDAFKVVLSVTASANNGEVATINDISRSFFHAKAKGAVCVQFPEEDRRPGEEHLCGDCATRCTAHGTRPKNGSKNTPSSSSE